MKHPLIIRINRYPTLDETQLPVIEIETFMPGVGLVDRRRLEVTPAASGGKNQRGAAGYDLYVRRDSETFRLSYPTLAAAQQALTEILTVYTQFVNETGSDVSGEDRSWDRSESNTRRKTPFTIWKAIIDRWRNRSRSSSPDTPQPTSD